MTLIMWERTALCFFSLLVMQQFAVVVCQSTVDLTGPGCDKQDGYYIKDEKEVITLYSEDHRDAISTRDRCDVTVRAKDDRRIEYLIENIRIQDCGVKIYIYDNPSILVNPLRTITCHDNGKMYKGKSRYNVMKLTVRKTTSQSRYFQFQMKMKDDRGPSIEYQATDANYVEDALDPGAIAGIAIAGAVIIIALFLLAIYLCVRARQENIKENHGDTEMSQSSVYTSGTSQVLFSSRAARNPKGRYGSMEDMQSTASSQEKTSGAYANAAYTTGPGEKGSERSASIGRSRGKAGFSNNAFHGDEADMGQHRGDISWEEREAQLNRAGEGRRSRRDAYDDRKKPMKSALKKPSEHEMGRVNTQPLNGILKTRTHSPCRSQESTEGSQDTNAMVHGYKRSNIEHPNVHHKPVLERRRSRSGTRSNRSGSSAGRSPSQSHRAHSADKKKPKPSTNSRMYSDVFIDEPNKRSGSRNRTRSNSLRSKRTDRYSDSLDSESSAASHSRKVSMHPGGKRVHIKGEETDI